MASKLLCRHSFATWLGGQCWYVPTPLAGISAGNVFAATGVWFLSTLRTYGPGASVFEGLLTSANIAFIVFTLYTNLAASCKLNLRTVSMSFADCPP